ncbi:hypothetical protein GOV06_03325 [Candidatus Woesearchaeota archaeon]|nr:hypothetical protein [Candidatus Woesearchaeota archaeon]
MTDEKSKQEPSGERLPERGLALCMHDGEIYETGRSVEPGRVLALCFHEGVWCGKEYKLNEDFYAVAEKPRDDLKDLVNKKEEPTPRQKQIEMIVTNGLGYDSRTTYQEKNPDLFFSPGLLGDSDIKNTHEGLHAHLAEMEHRVDPNKVSEKVVDLYRELAVMTYFYGEGLL